MNCYDALGVERNASDEQIRAAFRVRSHMFHPDKYENYAEPLRSQLKAEAEKEFKKLTLAYETLRDPRKRLTHDQQLRIDLQYSTGRTSAGLRRATRVHAAEPKPTARSWRAPEPAADQSWTGQDDARDKGQEHATRQAPVAARPREFRRPEREPVLVVTPQRLDFGVVAVGAHKQLALKISNAGGRTLFGEVRSTRSWLTVSRSSFISSSAFIFVTADTRNLEAGEEYTGTLVVTTLNGGDQVVSVSVRVAGASSPVAAVTPKSLEFGATRPGQFKTRTLRVVNDGSGTLVGSVTAKGGWLSVSDSRFRGNKGVFEVIAQTAGLAAGLHDGEVEIYTNGGLVSVPVTIDIAAPPAVQVQHADARAAAGHGAPGAGSTAAGDNGPDGPARLSGAEVRALLRRLSQIEPASEWERDLLGALERQVRAREPLGPGELQKLIELERRAIFTSSV